MSEQLKQFFDELPWKAPPATFGEYTNSQDVLIFRGHHALQEDDPALRVMGLLHGSVFFKKAAGYGAPCMQTTKPYLFPQRTGLISVYRPFAEQQFFPDETMEHILRWEEVGNPVSIRKANLNQGNAYETAYRFKAGQESKT